MNRYQMTKVTKSATRGDVWSKPIYLDDSVTMFSALQEGVDLAKEAGADIRFDAFNSSLGRWQHICEIHPDGTATDSFGDTARWTGDKGKYWEKV